MMWFFRAELCLRGWTMIGKKDTCPYCSEKVNMRRSVFNPWERQTQAWAQILDAVRYLIVWNPVILMMAQALFYFLPHTHPVVHVARTATDGVVGGHVHAHVLRGGHVLVHSHNPSS